MLNYIEAGRNAGAQIITGGQKWAEGGDGYWIEPTIFTDTTPDMTVVKEEVSVSAGAREVD